MFLLHFIKWLFRTTFAKQIEERELIKRKNKEFLEKFPCPHCRPDGCTFYYDILCYCSECGRKYYI